MPPNCVSRAGLIELSYMRVGLSRLCRCLRSRSLAGRQRYINHQTILEYKSIRRSILQQHDLRDNYLSTKRNYHLKGMSHDQEVCSIIPESVQGDQWGGRYAIRLLYERILRSWVYCTAMYYLVWKLEVNYIYEQLTEPRQIESPRVFWKNAKCWLPRL